MLEKLIASCVVYPLAIAYYVGALASSFLLLIYPLVVVIVKAKQMKGRLRASDLELRERFYQGLLISVKFTLVTFALSSVIASLIHCYINVWPVRIMYKPRR